MFDEEKPIPDEDRPAYDRHDYFEGLGRRRRLRRNGIHPETGVPLMAEDHAGCDG